MTLKEMRKINGYTQSALSKQIGVRQQQVSKYEKGLSIPSPKVARKLAAAFKCPVIEVLELFYSEETTEAYQEITSGK